MEVSILLNILKEVEGRRKFLRDLWLFLNYVFDNKMKLTMNGAAACIILLRKIKFGLFTLRGKR